MIRVSSRHWLLGPILAVAMALMFHLALVGEEKASEPQGTTDDAVGLDNQVLQSAIAGGRHSSGLEQPSLGYESWIPLPDGTRVPITLRERPGGIEIPNEQSLDLDLLEALDLLLAAVQEGRADAAFQLYELHLFCSEFLPDEAALGAARATAYGQQSYSGPWGLTISGRGSGERVEKMAQTVTRHYQECREIEQIDENDAFAWLDQAAKLGDPEALKYWGQRAGRSPEAVRAFEQAWQSGETYAAVWLADLHQRGTAEANPAVMPDPALAFAYQYLFTEVLDARARERGIPDHPFVGSARAKLAEMERGLPQHEVDRAYQIARGLIPDDCCFSN